MADGTGSTSYGYYPLGVLGADKVQTVQGPLPNSTITFGYDELGRVNSRAINGASQALLRDALARVTSITNALGDFTYQYDGVSRRVREVDGPNNRKTLFSDFDVLGDLRLQQSNTLRRMAASFRNLITNSTPAAGSAIGLASWALNPTSTLSATTRWAIDSCHPDQRR